jgi:hypothetical protein
VRLFLPRDGVGRPVGVLAHRSLDGVLLSFLDGSDAWTIDATDEEGETLAAALLEAIPFSAEHRSILAEAEEAEGQRVHLVLQTQGGLPDQPESVGPIREVTHETAVAAAMAAFDEVIAAPLLAEPAPSLEGVSTYLETMRAVERLRTGFRAAVLAKLRGK